MQILYDIPISYITQVFGCTDPGVQQQQGCSCLEVRSLNKLNMRTGIPDSPAATELVTKAMWHCVCFKPQYLLSESHVKADNHS